MELALMPAGRMTSHRWDSSLDPAVSPLFLNLQWAHARSLDLMKPLLVRHVLSAAEFDVLATLRNADAPHELTPTQVQDRVVITSGGLTKIMLQLESRDLVRRLQLDDDQRVKPVRLTAKGKRLIEKAMADMIEVTGAWLRARLDAAQMKQLTALLSRIADE